MDFIGCYASFAFCLYILLKDVKKSDFVQRINSNDENF